MLHLITEVDDTGWVYKKTAVEFLRCDIHLFFVITFIIFTYITWVCEASGIIHFELF